MIKRNDLRIGNKVISRTHNILNATVSGIMPTSGIITLSEVSTYDTFDKIDPIPLTHEWLERFGFDKQGDGSFYIQVGNTLYLEFDNDLSCSIIPETWSGSAVYTFADISHLHQLQNLYFALTGEELQIKDE